MYEVQIHRNLKLLMPYLQPCSIDSTYVYGYNEQSTINLQGYYPNYDLVKSK
jgi:hypothetical protein